MPNVIIVEDDQQLRDMLCYFLSTVEGYEVSCLTSGENAVEHRSGPPISDMTLSD
ncbi:hypothetical protein [Vibrio harveyi]|uniref:hypothetical protein n=1 Tax=Vibrio harveyi TaxID=669 RepID=UPI001F34B7D2|nr:hypothetical protein [Vibrio harveyi]